jgi:protein disulfide-isomerase
MEVEIMRLAKYLATLLFGVCITATVFAEHLSKSVPKGWGEDFTAAKEEASQNGKLLLIAFSGSDWCGWCMRMEKEIYSESKFINGAKKNFVLVMIDNPRDKSILSKLALKQNPGIISEYGISGYPCTIIAKPSGEVIKRIGGYQQGGVKAFLDTINAVAKEAGLSAGVNSDSSFDDGLDKRFFKKPEEKAKVAAQEERHRKANATNEFELTTFAGIDFNAGKSEGMPKLAEPYLMLKNVQNTRYANGKLVSITLSAPVKEVNAMSADELRKATCRLVQSIEKDLGIRFAVTDSAIDFSGRNTRITVFSSKITGALSVRFEKKR